MIYNRNISSLLRNATKINGKISHTFSHKKDVCSEFYMYFFNHFNKKANFMHKNNALRNTSQTTEFQPVKWSWNSNNSSQHSKTALTKKKRAFVWISLNAPYFLILSQYPFSLRSTDDFEKKMDETWSITVQFVHILLAFGFFWLPDSKITPSPPSPPVLFFSRSDVPKCENLWVRRRY